MRVLIACVLAAAAMLEIDAADAPFTLIRNVDLPRVEGRIDHLAFDVASGRLFVAALGNNTVEVVDTKSLAHVTSLAGFAEPQGIAIAADRRVVVIANRRSGRVQFLNADTQQPGAVIQPGENADNVRYDAAAKRMYVGYGNGAIAAIDPGEGRLLGQVAVGGHPESFQLERSGSRIFVNVPTAERLVVIDRTAMKVIATWPVATATANFPMALDEANHRLFIGCRRPAKALVFDTNTGKEIASFDIVGDTDDLFYDAARKRLYVSGGEGYIDVIQDHGGNQFSRVAHMPTASGARTALYVPDQSRLYLAVPHRGAQNAEIRVFEAH